MKNLNKELGTTVAVVGAGFTGLAAAYELARSGCKVIVLEKDDSVGGLAGCFDIAGQRLEKFYHHWFTSDAHIMHLVEELGVQEKFVFHSTKTGMYYANSFFSLSNPLDVLKFKPLSLIDRVRLGMLVLKAKNENDWSALESMTAKEWLIKLAGTKVYDVIWRPLLVGKFGDHAEEVSAVWIWNKLKLRGGSRGKNAKESLAYYRGGFSALAGEIVDSICRRNGEVFTRKRVTMLIVEKGQIRGVVCNKGEDTIMADHVLLTPALPIVAELLREHVDKKYCNKVLRIKYLANICLVLELERSLSDIYWLNVNDPDFPYVGIIEHTNMVPSETYEGRHIVYLSKYLPTNAPLYQMSKDEILQFSLPYIKKMFPMFDKTWIKDFHIWKEEYTQPIVTRHYSRLIPNHQMPIRNLWLSTMAQIYPEDRGTNYAIREGRKIARMIIESDCQRDS